MRVRWPLMLPLLTLLAQPAAAQERVDEARYEPKFRDPVIEELRDKDEAWQEQQDEETGAVRKRQKARRERERKEEESLKSSLPEAERPTSLDPFKPIWHHPPVAQFMTGTCWSFAATSMLESEAARLGGKRVKLSEMHTVYYEYLEKALRFVRERGDSLVSQGSQANAVLRVWKRYGAVPHEAYAGVVTKDRRHDHQRLSRELRQVLDMIKREGIWDEPTAMGLVAVVLNRHLGAPPQEFRWQGRRYTPQKFLKKVLKVNPDEYVNVMSTSKKPFHQRGEFEVPDNWWHDKSYHNVPLDEFYAALKQGISGGYGITVAIDVSEPGKDGANDVMFIPSFDIPASHINQAAREYRIAHQVTTDDHGVHLIGHATHAGKDWFLVKDSGRSSRRGKHKGYYFMREDYVRLKTLGFMVHRDAVKPLLAKIK